MPVLKYTQTEGEKLSEGLERRLVHLQALMTVIIDFTDGPQREPDPPHAHPHEQTCYVAEGEILFLMEGEETQHLHAGDLFYVPSGRSHCIQRLSPKVRLVDSFSPIREDFLPHGNS